MKRQCTLDKAPISIPQPAVFWELGPPKASPSPRRASRPPPQASPPLSDIPGRRFKWVLDTPDFAAADADRSKVRRVVFCSGKVFYDLAAKRAADSVEDVAVVRVELLYPFPQKQIANILATYPNATDVARPTSEQA